MGGLIRPGHALQSVERPTAASDINSLPCHHAHLVDRALGVTFRFSPGPALPWVWLP
jgi:hypothetical protein